MAVAANLLDTQHWLRPLREFMGEVDEVMAVTQRPFEVIEGESLCHALLRFESGKVVLPS